MKVSKISMKLVKPHTPTPQNLKNYKISFVDQFAGPLNFSVVLFYESKPENDTQLEESLAKILVQFYPLAGRYIKNDHMVDCSDQGVEFVEAEALDIELLDLIAKIDAEQLDALLPDQYFRADNQLLSIQATHFPCGGQAIAVSISHLVFDAASLGTFVAAWSTATNPDHNQTVGFKFTPSYDLPSLLPYKYHDLGLSMDRLIVEDKKIVMKRVVFDKVALTNLRSKLSPNCDGKAIPRVRVVCAVIAKAMIGLDRAERGRGRDFVISQAMNMRERTIPPQPKHACGNFAIFSLTRRRVAAPEAEEIELQDLVDLMGDAVAKSLADHVEILSPNRDGREIIVNNYEGFMRLLSEPDMNIMAFTDWSKFGFYEADFGWGKPVWTGIGPQRPIIRTTVLMSNKEGDGIEAWVHLNEDDMRWFEEDEYIKLFMTFSARYCAYDFRP